MHEAYGISVCLLLGCIAQVWPPVPDILILNHCDDMATSSLAELQKWIININERCFPLNGLKNWYRCYVDFGCYGHPVFQGGQKHLVDVAFELEATEWWQCEDTWKRLLFQRYLASSGVDPLFAWPTPACTFLRIRFVVIRKTFWEVCRYVIILMVLISMGVCHKNNRPIRNIRLNLVKTWSAQYFLSIAWRPTALPWIRLDVGRLLRVVKKEQT